MDALVALLLNWLNTYSDYDTSDIPPPSVVEVSPTELTRELYSDNLQNLPADGIDERIQAIYSWGAGLNGTIYVLASEYSEESFSHETGLENPLFQERLLHELVHHVQYHTGEYEKFACKLQGEMAAYQLSGQYLQQQNVTDPLPNRRWLTHMYSRC